MGSSLERCFVVADIHAPIYISILWAIEVFSRKFL